jgi:hypothetical protein
MSLAIICLITVLPLSLMSTYRLFLLPIHYLSPTEWQWRPGGQLGNSYKSSSVSPTTLATYFLYIVYLISIDLESSCLFNSSILQSLQVGRGHLAFPLRLSYSTLIGTRALSYIV